MSLLLDRGNGGVIGEKVLYNAYCRSIIIPTSPRLFVSLSLSSPRPNFP